ASNTKEIYSKGSFHDLRKSKIIKPQILEGQTVLTAATFVLTGIDEWQLGIVDYSPVQKWVIEKHIDAYSALKEIASLFELELRFRVITDGIRVTRRYIELNKRQSINSEKEIVFGKDLLDIIRKVD